MKIKIDAFAGIRPRVSSRLLGNEDATVAVNCRLYDGKLKGFKEPAEVEQGEIQTNLAVMQIGIEVVSFGSYIDVSQAGVEVVTRKTPAQQLAQAGIDVVSLIDPDLRITQAGVEVVSA